MNMKSLVFWACVALGALPLSAQTRQTPLTISGWLCDSLTREPQSFATVRLLEHGSTSKVLRVATTTARGGFKIVAPKAGRYTLEALVVGMQPVRREVDLSQANAGVSLDTLYIKEYSSSLGTATVTAQKPLVKAEIDKITYSMADDPEAQTNSTLEMLRKVPMVTVDGDDKIKVNGSSSFKVYVNGKPNKMMSANPSEIFKNYPASVIKKIEVITNPGAKYDAEGVAGVLNIITTSEASTSGYTLSPSVHFGPTNNGGNVFGMAQFGKLMLSANYGIGRNKPLTPYRIQSEREVFADDTNHLLKNEQTGDPEGLYQFGNLDASYEISSKDLFSASAGIYGWKGETPSVGTARMFATDGSQTYAYRQNMLSDSKYLSVNVSADYQHTFKENQYLTFSYRYDVSPSYTKSEILYSDLENVPAELGLRDLKTSPENNSAEHTAQADFTTTMGKAHTLSAGLKYIYRMNRSDNEEFSRTPGTDEPFSIDGERSLLYRHRGDIGAAYAEYNLKVKNWSLMAGSRYEYYRVRVSYPDGKRPAFSTDMSDWVPSLSMGYNLKPTMLLRAGYNLRLGRPGIGALSPYEVRNSPEHVSYGNPNLGSTKAHNLNLTYSTFGPKLTVNASLTHSFSNNELVNYSFIENGIQHTTYGNFMHSKVTSLSAYVNWTIVNGTTLNLNLGGNYSDYKSEKTNEHNSGFSGNLWGNLRQDLPWKLKASVWFGGSTKSVSLQEESPAYFFYGLGLSRSFLREDRLSVTLNTGNFIDRYRRLRTATLTEQFRSVGTSRVDVLSFSVGIRYRLGSLKATVKKAARSIKNTDVIQKSSGGQGGGNTGGGGM